MVMIQGVGLMKETIAPRVNLPPLLCRLDDRPPESLDYVGVAYGLTLQLFRYTCYVLFTDVH